MRPDRSGSCNEGQAWINGTVRSLATARMNQDSKTSFALNGSLTIVRVLAEMVPGPDIVSISCLSLAGQCLACGSRPLQRRSMSNVFAFLKGLRRIIKTISVWSAEFAAFAPPGAACYVPLARSQSPRCFLCCLNRIAQNITRHAASDAACSTSSLC